MKRAIPSLMVARTSPNPPTDMDFDILIGVTESPANQWNFTGLNAYLQNSLTALTGDGYFQAQIPSSGVMMTLDDDISVVNYETTGTINWDFCFYVFGGTIYAYEEGQATASPTNLGSVGSNTHFRIVRTGTAVKIQVSNGGVSFSDLHSFSNSSTGNLYAKGQDLAGGGGTTLINPIGFGFS